MALSGSVPASSSSAAMLSALSSASPVEAVVGGVVIGVAALGVLTYKAIIKAENKEYMAQVKAVQDLYANYLAKIKVNGVDQKFPPIFKIDNPDDPKSVESLHLTIAEVRDIGSFTAEGPETDLIKYKRKVNNAILELKAYYLARAGVTPANPDGIEEKQKDVTSGVLSYLLQMLNNHCINFSGYEYDIQFLKAITRFINKYADLKPGLSAHKSRLPEAYTNLEQAMAYLQFHQENLSLTDSLAELGSEVRDIADPLIRLLIQGVTPAVHWPLIETMTLENARKGIIRKQFVATVSLGIDLHNDSAVLLSNSIISDWIFALIDYYMDVINLKPVKIIPDPAKIFILPDLVRYEKIKNSKIKAEKAEAKTIKAQLDLIRHIFASTDSFITLKLDAKENFVKITDIAEMFARLQLLKELASLTVRSIAMQDLCNQLIKSSAQLGDIYVQNPHHYRSVFLVLQGLHQQIMAAILQLKVEMKIVNDSFNDKMMNATFADYYVALEEKLTEASNGLDKHATLVEELRKKAEENPGNFKAIAAREKRHMFELAEADAATFQIDNKLGGVQTNTITEIKETEPEESKADTVTRTPSPVSQIRHEDEKQNPLDTQIQQRDYPQNVAGRIAVIQEKIVLLKQEIKLSSELYDHLQRVYLLLLRMLTHFTQLSFTKYSINKAHDGLDVLAEWCEYVLRYLDSERNASNAKSLYEQVQIKVIAKNNFADVNVNPISAFFHTPTTSRVMLNELLAECKAIEGCSAGVRLSVAS